MKWEVFERRKTRLASFMSAGLVLLLTAACSNAAASGGVKPTLEQPALAPSQTPVLQQPLPSPTALFPTSTASPPSITPEETQIPTLPSPTPCSPDLCVFSDPFPLARPIAPPGRDTVDTSYRFGSTQNGKREPHHGVEFLNSLGTPVLAAAEGRVVVAGDDFKTIYGLYPNFYGNLVVLQHTLPGVSQPVFTLYGHLSKVSVQVGQIVHTGDEIGLVGMTGAATGSHLHFEVRLGENTYAASRNPELWLAPKLDENGQPQGAIAGVILIPDWYNLKVSSIVVERLPAPDQPGFVQTYLGTYEENDLRGQAPWKESFAAGDLPAGWYRITFIQNGLQQKVVQVFPGDLTVVTFDLENGN